MAKPQTITQKILAAHCGKDYVEPGELIMARVDIALGNDITAPLAIQDFHKVGAKKVFDRGTVVLVCDHFAPNKDIASANQCQLLRKFAREQDLTHFYDGGDMGVEHALLPETGDCGARRLHHRRRQPHLHLRGPGGLRHRRGLHRPGRGHGHRRVLVQGAGVHPLRLYRQPCRPWVTGKDLILHTIGDIGVDGALYLAMEFTGEAIARLPMADRFSMANMAVEAGAKNGIIAPDEITLDYVKGRTLRPYTLYAATRRRHTCFARTYEVSGIEPQVACPSSPGNVGAGFPGGGRTPSIRR